MSGQFGAVTFEGEINSIVREYLQFIGLKNTSLLFDEECADKGIVVNSSSNKLKNNSELIFVQKELEKCYRLGLRDNYFSLWYSHLPTNICDTDPVAAKLEFYVHLYFSIYPIKHKNAKDRQEALQMFQHYLQTKGSVLSQSPEFLPFYALPYVPDPTTHPTYKELFQDNWAAELSVRLEKFLSLALRSSSQPRLFEIYQKSQSDSSQDIHVKLVEAERRLTAYIKRHQKVNADYHNLIGITADLIDALESTIQGNTVTPEQVQALCLQLFSNHVQQSVDLRRPGTAAEVLRASVLPQVGNTPKNYPLLDYASVMADLAALSDTDKCLLLQALRWRLTRTMPGEQRDAILSEYIQNDIIGCVNNNDNWDILKACLNSDALPVKQYTARFLNVIASICMGRDYLSQNVNLVPEMLTNLQSSIKTDTATFENLLGCLQKLSLRRSLQSVMISEGVIEWLVNTLSDTDSLTDYTLEYSVALLMNLCLRTAGKNRCVGVAQELLTILSDLMGSSYYEIRPYINGTLYSMLAIPSIRNQAKAMGMEEMLKCVIKDDKPDMVRQVEFIIKQLNSSEQQVDHDSDDEDEEEEDEDNETLEAEIDKDELTFHGHHMSGEELLVAKYLSTSAVTTNHDNNRHKNLVSKERSTPLQRPVTPRHTKPPDILSISPPRILEAVDESLTLPNGNEHPLSAHSDRPNSAQHSQGNDESKARIISPAINKKKEQYQAAFACRPKIPRTPESPHSTSRPPPPVFSDSEPRPSSSGKSSNPTSPRKMSNRSKSSTPNEK